MVGLNCKAYNLWILCQVIWFEVVFYGVKYVLVSILNRNHKGENERVILYYDMYT